MKKLTTPKKNSSRKTREITVFHFPTGSAHVKSKLVITCQQTASVMISRHIQYYSTGPQVGLKIQGGKVVIQCLLKLKDLLLFRNKKNMAPLPPSGPTALFLEAIINCLCRVRRFVWQAKMTNRKKSIKICVCVHPPIYSSTTIRPPPLPAYSHKNNFHYY